MRLFGHMHVSLVSTATLVAAWDFGFLGLGVNAAQEYLGFNQVVPEVGGPKRIAIIGAGAAGSSSAFWIKKAKERHDLDVEVHVYDKNEYVGGRSTIVHPYDDPSLPPEELGASIFVKANKNLFRATEEFGLNVTDLADEDSDLGIWDGSELLLTYQGGWWDNAKMLWRYGYYSPSRTTTLVADMISNLLKAYTPEVSRWSTIEDLSRAVGFEEFTGVDGYDFFKTHGISNDKWVNEMIDAATRVNYAQDISAIHGLGASVSMATGGPSQVTNGNYLIFENFIASSEAKLLLNTTVTGLTKSSTSGKTRWSLSGGPGIPAIEYDQVIIAAPFHFTGITLLGSDAKFLPEVPYIHLHVTFVSTTSFRPRAEKFGLPTGTQLPSMLLTSSEGLKQGKPAPDFQSISYHKSFEKDGQTEHVFKIFSLDRKSDAWLEDVFGAGTLGWVHRKEWDSYPKLLPTTAFPKIHADEGLWYVNALEPWISTMETEVLAARNTVDNMLRLLFDKGICPDETSPDGWGTKIEDTKVYGWDC